MMLANFITSSYIVIKCMLSSTTFISLQLVWLNGLIGLLGYYKLEKEYKKWLISLQIIITLGFIVNNMFMFYICFELMLLPIYYTIYYSGQTNDKIYVSYKFMYFTLSGSLCWLVVVMLILNLGYFDNINYQLYGLMFLIALLIKLPMPPFHFWLNDTHTASPVSSSILLAGTVLKLSMYGFITFYLTHFTNTFLFIKSFLITLLVIGCIYTSLACIRQIDYKRLIAYTSVGHMNLTLFSILSLNYLSIYGAFLLLLAHGLISASLFYHVNDIYERFHTKLYLYLRGLSITMPIASLFALLLHIFNFSMPPAISWFSEYTMFSITITEYSFATYLISLIMIISMIYTLWIYFRVYYGDKTNCIVRNSDLSLKSTLLIIMFCLLTLFSMFIVILI